MPNVMATHPDTGGALCSVGWLGFNGTFNTE